jgi:hypothetical protein
VLDRSPDKQLLAEIRSRRQKKAPLIDSNNCCGS